MDECRVHPDTEAEEKVDGAKQKKWREKGWGVSRGSEAFLDNECMLIKA